MLVVCDIEGRPCRVTKQQQLHALCAVVVFHQLLQPVAHSHLRPFPCHTNTPTHTRNNTQTTGVYACTAVPPECGTAAGSPCCPFADKISTNPPLPRTGCGSNTSLFCNYDVVGLPKAVLSVKPEYLSAAVSGTCEANAADCSQFGKSCCVTTGPTSTSFVCGARWNETGQRGYCADPFANRASVGPRAGAGGGARALVDGSNTSSNSNNTSTNSSSGASGPGPGGDPRRASFKELVCTPCPARSDSVADNPSKYWPC